LAGHSRRDYWLAIISEVLYAHRFVRKFDISGVDKDETILKAALGILRLQAIEQLGFPVPNRYESLLMFNLCDKVPGGDFILETRASVISSRTSDRSNQPGTSRGMHAVLSNLGVVSPVNNGERLFVGEMVVGEISSLQKAVIDSMNNYKKVELAQATVDGVKVEGLDTNLAVMKVNSEHKQSFLSVNYLPEIVWHCHLLSPPQAGSHFILFSDNLYCFRPDTCIILLD